MTLDEVIQQLINLGEKDPVTIAQKVEARHGTAWISDQLAAYAMDLVAEMARLRLGAERRASEIALRPGEPITQAEMKLRAVWVPGAGWKRANDLTADDLRAKAVFYDRLAFAARRRAEWCNEVAALMEREGAATLGRLRVELPPLPDDDGTPEELAA